MNMYKGIFHTTCGVPPLEFEFQTDNDETARAHCQNILETIGRQSWFLKLGIYSTSVEGEPGVVTFNYERRVDELCIITNVESCKRP
jgi:hypothetical protein